MDYRTKLWGIEGPSWSAPDSVTQDVIIGGPGPDSSWFPRLKHAVMADYGLQQAAVMNAQ